MINSSREWLLRENSAFARSLPAGSLVLDAGAGSQPYRHLFDHCRYEAADFEKVDKPYAKSTYVCDLVSIPVEDGRFDAVALNQVLEHLSDPLAALAELHRVLKPGGSMICSAPLFYEEHEQPYDFFRYTQYAWRHLMAKAGFEIVSICWLEGYLGTVAYQMERASRYLPTRPHDLGGGVRGWIASPILIAGKPILRVLAALFYRLDARHRYTAAGYPKNYVVVVKKPAAQGAPIS
ncbi:SAM-dependent methyltransferase (plasmid) [Ensifer sp. WSM1721]|uniref:class I SAM-dependent methyltransferase n=1 Tax=Ensifer sp. WSM1721 TaxID=1041159 RepID=UPI0035259EA6